MRSFNDIHNRLEKVIINWGNDGVIKHINKNSIAYDEDGKPRVDDKYYDKDGLEIDIDSLPLTKKDGEELELEEKKEAINNQEQLYFNGQPFYVTKLTKDWQVRYVVKQLRGDERIPNSSFDEQIRVTIITPFEVRKQDIFKSFRGYEYSIENVNYVGQTQNGTLILELICIRV